MACGVVYSIQTGWNFHLEMIFFWDSPEYVYIYYTIKIQTVK